MPNPEFKNPEILDLTKEVKYTTTNENQENSENRVLANINNAEDPWKTALDIMNNGNSREAYYVIRNLNQFENKINSETEKNIINMAIKKCRQPWSVLSHWKNFTLLSKEDKTEIAQTFVECGDTDILRNYVNKLPSSIDDESRKIFKSVISSMESDLDRILLPLYEDSKPSESETSESETSGPETSRWERAGVNSNEGPERSGPEEAPNEKSGTSGSETSEPETSRWERAGVNER